jgi:hypothetical protein
MVLIDGVPDPNANVGPNPGGTGLVAAGRGWTMRVQGLDPKGQPIDLGPSGSLVVDAERDVRTTGTGFAPGTRAVVYLNPPVRPGVSRTWWRDVVATAAKTRKLGSVRVVSDGTFAGRVALPESVAIGAQVLQVVGVAPDGTTRALTVGLTVQPWITIAKGARTPAGCTRITPRGGFVPPAPEPSRCLDRVSLRGDTGGLPARTVLTPYLRYQSGKDFVRGTAAIKVKGDGTFTWSRKIKSGKALAVYIVWQDTRSKTVRWPKR